VTRSRPRPARARTRPHDSRSTRDPPLLAREVLVAGGTQRTGTTLQYGKRHRRDVRRRQKEFEKRLRWSTDLEGIEWRYNSEAVSSPGGVTHLTFTRR
jgi:hypothetical protein